ncbi:hypothetical protein BD414DRAFT_170805 [Trametes punicea]|nr:hypothetical protein BD414DRAFT_170805 [Trametes punicea]
MLARQNGWTRCAELLSQWTHVKDKDLRERELPNTVPSSEFEPASRLESLECKVTEKKLKVKRSIDNALHMLRPTLLTPPPSGYLPADAMYTASPPPITESASVDSSPEAMLSSESRPRRPSLPHLFDPAPYTQGHSHGQTTSTGSHHFHHGKSSSRPSFSSSRRPRSAGTDAEPSASASVSCSAGRLRGKISLLHMFKKSSTGDSSASTPGLPATPDSRDSLSGYASSSSALTSASASPAPEREVNRSRAASASQTQSPLRTRASESGLASPSSASSSPSPYLTTIPSSRSRLASESPMLSSSRAAELAAYPPLAIELHRKLSAERLRARSGSGSSSSGTTEARAHLSPPAALPPQAARSPPTRPGILRPHHRSTSSGQSLPPSQSQDGATRSLRFDSSASAQSASVAARRSRSGLNVKVSVSVSSLRGEGRDSPRSPRPPVSSSASSHQHQHQMQKGHAHATGDDDEDDEEEEEGYGEVISPRLGLGLGLVEGKSRLNELRTGEKRNRRPSASSQISHEGSPLPSPTAASSAPAIAASAAVAGGSSGFDCPFSINRPPPQPLPPDAAQSSSQSSQAPFLGTELHSSGGSKDRLGTRGVDNRGRGDSIGSMSTSTDASASAPQTPLPAVGSAMGLGLGLGLHIRSPDALPIDLPPSIDLPPPEVTNEAVAVGADADKEKTVEPARSRTDSSVSVLSDTDASAYLHARTRSSPHASGGASRATSPRPRAPPLDIDIRAISSHAQAEALVQRAQKSILEMEDVDIELPGFDLGLLNSAASGGVGLGLVGGANGRTPLSAKLAAYGETLAIERRFKEQERERERELERERGFDAESGETPFGSPTTPSGRTPDGRLRPGHSERAMRKFSLEEGRPGNTRPSRRSRVRRPHTADASHVLIDSEYARIFRISSHSLSCLSPIDPVVLWIHVLIRSGGNAVEEEEEQEEGLCTITVACSTDTTDTTIAACHFLSLCYLPSTPIVVSPSRRFCVS